MEDSDSETLAIHGGPAVCFDQATQGECQPLVNAAVSSIFAWPRAVDLADRRNEWLAQILADGSWGHYEGDCSEELRRRLVQLAVTHHVDWVASEMPRAQLASSGTIAVELALRGAQVAGGEVVLAGYDFPGNFRAIENAGAKPVLVDLRPGGYSLDPEQLPEAIGDQTRALLVSHLHGERADVASLRRLIGHSGRDIPDCPGRLPGAGGDHDGCRFGGLQFWWQ